MAKKKPNPKDTPKVNPELEGFDIRIDSFGEIKTNYDIEKINAFLNKNVDDKKLRDRDDLVEPLKSEEEEEREDNDGADDDFPFETDEDILNDKDE